MKRRWKILLGLLGALALLLAVNTFTTNNETKSAEVTVEGGRILQLSGGDLQVVDSGEPAAAQPGQPIVLLHCYACSLRWWDKLAPLLERTHRVIRIDLLGFGGSEKPESGYEIPNQAKLVAEAMNQLGVQGALVAGHSMGGAVATSLAEQASQLVDRVILIDSGPDLENYGSLPLLPRIGYVPVIGQAMWRITPSFAIKDGFQDAFAPDFDLESGFDDPDQVIEDYRAMTYTSFEEARAARGDYTEESPLHNRLTRAAVPLLAMLGSEDQIVDPEKAADAYRTVPGAQVEIIRGAGHAPQIEKPEQVAELLHEFALEGREYQLDAALSGGEGASRIHRIDRRPSPNRRGGQPRKNRPQSGARRDASQAKHGPLQEMNRTERR